jgi:hypothetical protein
MHAVVDFTVGADPMIHSNPNSNPSSGAGRSDSDKTPTVCSRLVENESSSVLIVGWVSMHALIPINPSEC